MVTVELRVILEYRDASLPQRRTSGPIPYGERFVALDLASSGYPYPVDILRAHNFKTVENAEAYACGEGFIVRKILVGVQFI